MTRMVRMRVAVLLVTGAPWAPLSAAAEAKRPDFAKWSHVATVQVQALPAKGIVELAIPEDVFGNARADLADLRLAGEAGEVVPYVLRVDRGTAGRAVSYEPRRLFNPTYLPGKQSSITVDFGSTARRTHIDVDTPGENFRRRVMVEAGQDGQSWQVLRKTAWLFHIAYEKGSYSKRRVTLPDNDFRYLRVTVFNAPDDPERVEARKVLAQHVTSSPPKTADAAVRSRTVTEKPRVKATEIDVDLGHENLPIRDVILSFADENFLRRVEILGRNRRKRTVTESVEDAPPRKREVVVPWRSLAGGTIHRFSSPGGKAESADLSLSINGKCRYLLVRIHNGDNAPLKFTGIEATRLQYFLAFPAEAKGAYRLYMGNSAAAKPQYDLRHFIDRLRAQGVTHVAPGAVSPNPLFGAEPEAVPWSEQHKALLWGVLVAVLVVLGVLVLRQARRVRPEGGQ
jgi:hypothetical protein